MQEIKKTHLDIIMFSDTLFETDKTSLLLDNINSYVKYMHLFNHTYYNDGQRIHHTFNKTCQSNVIKKFDLEWAFDD